MAGKKLYKDYFNIDPKYYAAVTADLIESGMVSWRSFYPHETFVKLLEKHILYCPVKILALCGLKVRMAQVSPMQHLQ